MLWIRLFLEDFFEKVNFEKYLQSRKKFIWEFELYTSQKF